MTSHRLDHIAIQHLEQQVISLCQHAKTLEELQQESRTLWQWASDCLHKDIDSIRTDIISHASDEHFPTPFQEEKDHLLKLPLYLLEHLNRPPKDHA